MSNNKVTGNNGGPNKRFAKLEQERERATAHHEAYSRFLKESILGKLCLVGIQAQGIERTYVTAIEASMTGAIAIALSSDKNAGEDGMMFDLRQLTIYRIYTDEEAVKYQEKFSNRVANQEASKPLEIVK